MIQGIPDNVQQEQPQNQQAQPQAGDASEAQAAEAAAAAAASGLTGSADEPLNLFEAAAQANEGGGGRGARGGAGAGAGDALGNLDFLRSNPHFQQLRQLVQQQPQMLEPILQQVAAGNPQIAQIIGQNSDRFLELLSEDVEDDEASLPPGTQAIQVTEDERDAIERVSEHLLT